MLKDTTSTTPSYNISQRLAEKVTLLFIFFCILLQIHLAFLQPINWDEFRFLADVHSYLRGDLSSAFLTFHVHLFGWLGIFGNEIQQIIVARLAMLALEMCTLFFIWKISRNFFDQLGALFGVLAYISFSFVLQHGASFRFDPIVTSLVMGSVALLLRERLTWVATTMVGLALALATMVSVKTVLALPLILVISACNLERGRGSRKTFTRLLFGAFAALLFLAIMYVWHLNALPDASGNGTQQNLVSSYEKTVRETRWFPGYRWFERSLFENPLHWLILLIGFWGAIATYRGRWRSALALFAFTLPLLTITFYRNSFPYFYAFVLAPASVLMAAAVNVRAVRKFALLVGLVWTVGAFTHYRLAQSSDAEQQREVVELVHTLFPEPVPYIDRCSMVSSFPQAGVFLSSWWLENYQDARRPIISEILRQKQPVFIIVNSLQLSDALNPNNPTLVRFRFSQNDRDALASNYVHYSGPLWLAGKKMSVPTSGVETEFIIGGEYILESRAPITIDSSTVRPGEKVIVSAGVHRIASAARQLITLRWAAVPAARNPTEPSLIGFGRF